MTTLKKSTLVMLLIAAVLMAGCKKEENNGNNENTETVGHKNPNPAQDTPLSEHFLQEFESIYQLYLNSDGSFYALADEEHTDYLLKLDNNGYVQHRTELGFRSLRCISKSGNNIVLIGNSGKITSPYSMFKQGYVAVYDGNMQLTAMTYVNEPQYKIGLYTLIQDSQNPNQFFAGGYAIDENYVQYPYLCSLEFSDGMIRKIGSKILSDYAKYRIVGMVEKNYAGQRDFILETIHYTVLDHPYHHNSCAVHFIKPNINEEESGWGSQTWDVAITGSHNDSYTGNNSIDSDENNVYFFGYCNDDKEPAPSNGYWSSGCIAAVNWHNGQLIWMKKVSLTNKDDCFEDGFVSEGYLYAWGVHSGLQYNNTKKHFANGLIIKLNLSGDIIGYKTFGEPERKSWLYNVVKDKQGNMACVGHSDENIGDGDTKLSGWFLKTDITFEESSKTMSEDMKKDDMDPGSISVPMDIEIRF